MKNIPIIDFVVTWVDGCDPDWLEKKAKYTGKIAAEGNSEARYRDWDTLKYWFRGVEKFAPWVNNIYFVTDNQKPEWLDVNHPKLKWVKHTDFIPEEYLPTFSSDTIEWNLHKIESLAENFVYFNDDVFIINNTTPEDFFINGLPCDFASIGVLYANGIYSNMMFNNTELLNRNFSLKDSIKKNSKKWFKGQSVGNILKILLYGRQDLIPFIDGWHIHVPYKKQVFTKVYEKEAEAIRLTCLNKTRTRQNITSWVARTWQLLSGDFYPKKPIGKAFNTSYMNYNNDALEYLSRQKGKVICLNDSEDEENFEQHKQAIICEFEKLFPEKSSFEI